MTQSFVFDEKANSPDLTDAEVEGAVATSTAEDVAAHLKGVTCASCQQPMGVIRHEKRFRFPHFYWRTHLLCPNDHASQRVFQVTWLYPR